MPEALAAPPPTAPAAPAAPAAKPEIKVSSLPAPTQVTPAKPGSAKERMNKELESRFADKPSTPEAKPAEAAKPAEVKPGEATPPAAEAKPGEAQPAADGKKKNPWKMLDEERANARKLSEQLSEANKRALPETEWKAHQEKLTAAEKRNKELEDEIRYVNYQKSEEFQTKYQKPFEDAWKRALQDLGELQVDDGSGNVRAFNAKDLIELTGMSLPKAREKAVALYGDFADDVMQHRKELMRLHGEQTAALEDVKKNGATRDKENQEKAQREEAERNGFIKQTWDAENESAAKNEKVGKYFTPREGDTEGNHRLEAGYKLADQAFSESPFDPRLTPEKRKEIVSRHAAVRNRCAAFGRLVYDLDKSTARISELEAELARFKGSEPGAVAAGRGQPQAGAPAQGGSAKQRLFGDLEKIAKPR